MNYEDADTDIIKKENCQHNPLQCVDSLPNLLYNFSIKQEGDKRMSTTNINIRINTELKKSAELLFDDLGLNMSTAITMFLKSAVNHNGIPFEVKRVVREPLALGAMTMEELHAELEKAHQDVLAGRTEPADKVFSDIRKEFGL